MGNPSREKGDRFERQLVHAFTDAGMPAERTPLSGAVKGSFSDDLIVQVNDKPVRFELKKRADGFKQLYSWLSPESTDALVVAADRKEALVVLPFKKFAELVKR